MLLSWFWLAELAIGYSRRPAVLELRVSRVDAVTMAEPYFVTPERQFVVEMKRIKGPLNLCVLHSISIIKFNIVSTELKGVFVIRY